MPRFGRLALASLVLGAGAALAACGSAPASAGPAASLPPGTYAVEAKEYAFTPSALSAPAGEVTFQVRNAGSETHEFEIFQGDTVIDEIEGIVPGLTKTLSKTLAAGEYTFVCKLNGHDQLGMKGTLTITAS